MDASRISLRPAKLSDADDFFKWASDDRVTRYMRLDTVKSKEEAVSHVEKCCADAYRWYRMICVDDCSVGFLSVTPKDGEDRCIAHVSYGVGADWWGRGVATAALRLAVTSAFEELSGVVRLETVVELENIGSQRVLEKDGFMKEGLLRQYGYCKGQINDVFIYSFLRSDKIL